MHPTTRDRLLEINRVFYDSYGAAFAATRRRIQNGVRRVLDGLPDPPAGRWLDVGCGSGALAAEWLRLGRTSSYLGVDFSAPLLESAAEMTGGGLGTVAFRAADLSSPGWSAGLEPGFAGVLCFAVLHHLPSHDLRLSVLRTIRGLLAPGGRFTHSEWQFQHSPKWLARRLPWSAAGVDEGDLEPGDTLLDFRGSQAGEPGLRYVHLFTRAELAQLAGEAGFHLVDEFESDGEGGRLSLYQVWE